jgi:hypothetical protein
MEKKNGKKMKKKKKIEKKFVLKTSVWVRATVVASTGFSKSLVAAAAAAAALGIWLLLLLWILVSSIFMELRSHIK